MGDEFGRWTEDHGVERLSDPIKENVGLVLPLLIRTPVFVFEVH